MSAPPAQVTDSRDPRTFASHGFSHLTDASLDALTRSACGPSLTELNLSFCEKITDRALEALFKVRCPHLLATPPSLG
eukprot:SAG11_NODE_1268_length_5342_cov_1.710853_4_plen_78_part_00